jgi:hypothetical protein
MGGTKHGELESIVPGRQLPPASHSTEVPVPRLDPALALRRTAVAQTQAFGHGDFLALQRTIGNQALQRSLARRQAQELNSVGDFGPRDSNGVAARADIAVDSAGTSSGHTLPDDVRGRFEGSLGTDLSAVRIHTGTASAEAARAVGAKAYTVGQDIHFGAGQYAPTDPAGVHLLAHEVAHTAQNQGAVASRMNRLEVSSPVDAAEVEADRAADAMVARAPVATRRDDPASGQASGQTSGQRLGRIPLDSTPKTIARAEMKTNGGSFKVDNYEERDSDKGNDTDKSVGANIEITFTPAETVVSDKISFVQIMKTTSDGTPFLFENEKPRATDARSGDPGWAVDRLAGKKSANYAQNDDGSAGGNTIFGKRTSKTDFTNAWMHDTVNLPRKQSKTFSVNATTFALDNAHSKYLGGVTWGFNTDAAGKTTKKTEAIQSMGDPGGVQKSALEKWNEQAALGDRSKRNAPDQQNVPVP